MITSSEIQSLVWRLTAETKGDKKKKDQQTPNLTS